MWNVNKKLSPKRLSAVHNDLTEERLRSKMVCVNDCTFFF